MIRLKKGAKEQYWKKEQKSQNANLGCIEYASAGLEEVGQALQVLALLVDRLLLPSNQQLQNYFKHLLL